MEKQEATNTTNQFIKVNFDKFKDRTTTELVWPETFSQRYMNDLYNLGTSDIPNYNGSELSLTLKHVKTPDIDSDLSLIEYVYMGVDWAFLGNGEIIINLDGNENITLKATETYTKVGVIRDSCVAEVGYYAISKAELKRVCDAKSIEVRIEGGSFIYSLTNEPNQKKVEQAILPTDKFLFMCRAFYSGFYVDSSYSEWLDTIVAVGPENKKSSSGGCFIATAAMGDYNHPVVVDLRIFRDEWLLKRNWGVQFTSWYYTHGPKAAYILEKSETLKTITFILLVKPLHLITKVFT
jgi:hypothetical protein